jgi:hypothetical protein
LPIQQFRFDAEVAETIALELEMVVILLMVKTDSGCK